MIKPDYVYNFFFFIEYNLKGIALFQSFKLLLEISKTQQYLPSNFSSGGDSNETMIEEKENMTMVSPTAGDPFRKKAYFLKPVVPSSSIDEPPFELPQSFSSLPSRLDPKIGH